MTSYGEYYVSVLELYLPSARLVLECGTVTDYGPFKFNFWQRGRFGQFFSPWFFQVFYNFSPSIISIFKSLVIPAIWLALSSVMYSRITSGSKSHHFCFKSHHFRSILHRVCVGYKMRRISLFVFAFQPETGYQIK